MIRPSTVRRWRRTLSWHRRGVAAVLAATAALALLAAVRPPSPPRTPVLVAARDLAGGLTLGPDDLRLSQLPPENVPLGALPPGAATAGRVLAAPAREGEPITDVRLVGPSLLGRYAEAGLVAAPVRLEDADAVRLLAPGDLVDVLASAARTGPDGTPTGGPARTVASRARVVTVPRGSDEGLLGSTGEGALVLLAVTPSVASDLAGAQAGSRLSAVLRSG